MFSQCLLVMAMMWSSGTPLPFPQANSNTTRFIMRLSGTFSVSNPSDPSVGSRFGDSTRPSNPRDAVITFKNGDSIISASPGMIDRSIAEGVSQLAVNIDQAIGSEGKSLLHDQNVIFSPASISMALALVLLGARGQTAQEVARVLGIATPQDLSDRGDLIHEQFGYLLSRFSRPGGPTQISIANGVFIQRDYPINPRFERLSRGLYRSDIIPVDFRRDGDRAASTINRWVEEKTSGRITGFLSQPPSPQTQVLLANAIYFNGEWETPFPIETTRRRPFYVTGSKQNEVGSEVVEVDMMAGALEVPYLDDPELGCQLVALPYKGGSTAMWLALPKARGYEGLNELKARLTSQVLEDMISRATVTSTIVTMPRMKLEATINLRSVLQGMGVVCLFDARCSDLGAVSSADGSSRPARPVSSSRPVSANRPVSSSRPVSANRPTYRPVLADSQDSDVLIFSRFGEGNDNNADPDAPTHETDRRRQTGVKGKRRRQARQSTNPGLYVDDVVHKVEIEVTETGTVASATTALTISRDGSHRTVRMDRPFLFFIRHADSRLVLFWGAVVRPTA